MAAHRLGGTAHRRLVAGGAGLGLGAGSENWQTVVLTVLTLSQLAHAMAIRFERDSLFHIGSARNPALLGVIVLTLGLQMAAVYTPFLQGVLHTSTLTFEELAVCA
ncbi:MAG: cation transporting ATPase C-terminal domain-containing protein [Gammaproteobacteria bacterium]|jgi:Ca2+-transporting ATPase|nr:cation transporting ATPase C-terminal domain-containing protein [Gammaproteobacteria bacterium]